MTPQTLPISKIKLNDGNPRFIKDDRFEKLVDSVLAFPKMLSIRPIVVDENKVCLGGNMRFRALSMISKVSAEQIRDRLQKIRKFQQMDSVSQATLLNYWFAFIKDPKAEVVFAGDLTEEEKQEFIVKDNIAYGSFDFDVLSNEWEFEDLLDWGFEKWEFGMKDEDPEEDKKRESPKIAVTHTCPECGHQFSDGKKQT